ncbi:MAG: T9SS type A sorting domain-containing protein [Bacteroidota bacterium]
MKTNLTLFHFFLFCLIPSFGLSATFTVTNTLDTGAGSLRDAITQANASGGADIINFAVAGTITLGSDLPAISEGLFIDGSSAPGWALAAPVIVLDGNNVVNNIIHIQNAAPASHIRGLVLSNANTRGIYLQADNCTVSACFIGTDISGTLAASTNTGIYIQGDNNMIGVNALGNTNLISGNNIGITIFFGTTNNSVVGNLIGTDISGNNAVANTSFGVQVYGDNALIGGNNAAGRNIISGNGNGVQILGDNATVRNNYVGLNTAGNAALGNTGLGILIQGEDAVVGGFGANEGNVVSGNGGEGIGVSSFGYSGAEILGNYIGVDPTGTIAFGNARNGIALNGGATDVIIGGLAAQSRNIISNNGFSGITCNTGRNNFIYGNYIGTDVTATQPMGNQFLGIAFNSAGPNYIGNATAAGANVICDNVLGGISLNGPDSDSSQIKFNYIGTNPAGLLNLGNDGAGVYANGGAEDNEIGGPLAGEGNIIAFNDRGVLINFAGSTRNLIQRNSIYDNVQEGIFLSAGNNNQAAPVLTGFANGPGTTTLFGTFNSAPNTNYRLEFFSSSTNDQGKTFLGFTNITTDGAGAYALAEVLPVTVTGAEPIVSVTATDPNDNTSEFGTSIVLDASFLRVQAEVWGLSGAKLSWEIPTDQEARYFEIEHKQKDKPFATRGQQSTFSLAQGSKQYQYSIPTLAPGLHFFRIKRFDPNGSFSYSSIVQLEVQTTQNIGLKTPNPLSGVTELELSVRQGQYLELNLYSLEGKKLSQIFAAELESDSRQKLSFDASRYPAGLYLLELKSSQGVKAQKVIIE